MELLAIAAKCDGVRCDMAMLLVPGSVQRTWGMTPAAVLADGDRRPCARAHPGFTFMAEVYWDLEWEAAAAGLRLHLRQAALRPTPRRAMPGAVSRSSFAHLSTIRIFSASPFDFWRTTTSPERPRPRVRQPATHRAAAILTFLLPGPAVHSPGPDGGGTRCACRCICAAARSRPAESGCRRLLRQAAGGAEARPGTFRDGAWSQLQPQPAWARQSDVAWLSSACAWQARGGGSRHVVVVNYAGTPGAMPAAPAVPRIARSASAPHGCHGNGGVRSRRHAISPITASSSITAPWHFNVFELRAATG